MSSNQPLAGGSIVLQGGLVDKSGLPTQGFQKWLNDLQTRVQTALTQQGQIQSTVVVEGLPASLAKILANLDANGIMLPAGIDFSRIYTNQNVNYIADGAGSPLAGGKAAYAAFIASLPANGQVLVYNGATWVPTTLAAGGVTQIVAGANITITPVGGTGAVTINGAAAGTAYIKGSVTVACGGAMSGTFTGSAAVAGAGAMNAAIASCPSLISLCGTHPVNWSCDVLSAGNVEVQVTVPNIGVGWGNLTFSVVVFP